MSAPRRLAPLLVALATSACGGNGAPAHVEISNMTPQAGAAVAAHAVCERESRCGSVTISCQGSGTAGGSGSDGAAPTTTCVGTLEPVAYDKCFSDASSGLAALLACPSLTAAQVDTLETCFDMLAAEACPTQADADALARAGETGGQIPRPEPPAACALLVDFPPGCTPASPTR